MALAAVHLQVQRSVRSLAAMTAGTQPLAQQLAPSLAARHSGSFAEFAPPVGVNGPLVFVARRWLDDSLAAGRRLEEAEYSFAAGGGGEGSGGGDDGCAVSYDAPAPWFLLLFAPGLIALRRRSR